jgi:hypothetical protein
MYFVKTSLVRCHLRLVPAIHVFHQNPSESRAFHLFLVLKALLELNLKRAAVEIDSDWRDELEIEDWFAVLAPLIS